LGSEISGDNNPAEANLQKRVIQWLQENALTSLGFFNIQPENVLLGDSGNRHRIDIVLQRSSFSKEELDEIPQKAGRT
jgi:hypothetical protein